MFRALIALTLAFEGCIACAGAQDLRTIAIPEGTVIKMYVPGEVVPSGVLRGESVSAQAAADVIVDGLVVVRKGAAGKGTIAEVVHSRTRDLRLTFDWVFAADGTKIQLVSRPEEVAAPTLHSGLPDRLRAFGAAGLFLIDDAFARANGGVAIAPVSPEAR